MKRRRCTHQRQLKRQKVSSRALVSCVELTENVFGSILATTQHLIADRIGVARDDLDPRLIVVGNKIDLNRELVALPHGRDEGDVIIIVQ